jgi:hypothetical protein
MCVCEASKQAKHWLLDYLEAASRARRRAVKHLRREHDYRAGQGHGQGLKAAM